MNTPAPPDRYAVVGNPVEHSRSPFIHAMFARATGQAIDYGRVLAPLDGFDDAVRAFAAEGGRGCNVTVPFKFQAFALAPRRSERAELAQAANTLRFDAEGWFADNTDGVGLVRDIERNAGVALAGRHVLLIGAGGAAAGVLGALIATGPERIQVVNRTREKAHALVERHGGWAATHGTTLAAGALEEAETHFDVVINGSASSLAGGQIPAPDHVLRAGTLALDMMYGAPAQPFLDWAAAHGARGRDGLGMLVEQAAEAFFVWRGVMPDTSPVLRALREQLAKPRGA